MSSLISISRIVARSGRNVYTENIGCTLRRKLLAISRGISQNEPLCVASSSRNVFTGEPEIKAKSYTGRRAFLASKRTSVPSRFASTSICHGWMFSKAICPSTGYAGPSTRKLSHSVWSTYFSANNPACRKFSPRGNTEKGVLCGTTSRRRRFSSEDSSCNKTSTSDRCGDRTSVSQEAPKDQRSKRKPDASSCSSVPMEVCPKPSTACTPSVKDPCPKPCPAPVCPAPEKPAPCPNVDDYCVTEVSQKERFYRFLSLFVAMPLIVVMSFYVYTREMEKKKQPRPEFVDVPYMRRIKKVPFPRSRGNIN